MEKPPAVEANDDKDSIDDELNHGDTSNPALSLLSPPLSPSFLGW
jgi:hypothetical protein